MDSRPNLQTFLEKLINSRNVYFDPPSSIAMRYDAIRFTRKKIDKLHANNGVYKLLTPYELTVISRSPESYIINLLLQLPYCSHDRHYVSDNLHHDVFTLYY
jgi:hypothetical protein